MSSSSPVSPSGSRGRAPVAFLHVTLVLATLLAGCVESAVPGVGDAGERPPGRLVVVGGGLDRDNVDVYRAVVEARAGDGPLCVLPTASGVAERSMASAVERFRQDLGPDGAVGIFIPEDSAHLARDSATVRALRGCSGFWFTGGVQSRIVDVFRPGGVATPAYEAMVERHRAGAVIAGSSAGAAMMSDPMIAGGGSAEAMLEGLRDTEDGDGVRVQDGMGFFEAGFVDQHFLARGRWGRLVAAVVHHPQVAVGFGIDENTALVVDGEEARVVGASGVLVVDGRSVVHGGDGVGVEGVGLTLAGAGDRIDLSTLSVTPEMGKAALERQTTGSGSGQASEETHRQDPFGRWALLHLLTELSTSDEDRLELPGEGYDLVLRRGPGFRAASHGEGGVEGAPADLHAGPFLLDVRVGRQEE